MIITRLRATDLPQYSFILCLIINSFRYIFRSSEDEFLETLTILKPNPKTAQKLHKAMIKELYSGMIDDLEDVLKEGSLYETLTKIAKLSEESTTSANKYAWSVVYSLKNRFVIAQCNLLFESHPLIAGVHRGM